MSSVCFQWYLCVFQFLSIRDIFTALQIFNSNCDFLLICPHLIQQPFSPAPKSAVIAKSTPQIDNREKAEAKPHKDGKPSKKAHRPLKFDDELPVDKENGVTSSKETAERQKKNTKTKSKLAEKSKHYCYSVDLRSVKNLDIEQPIRCFCRWEEFVIGSILALRLSARKHQG